MENKKMVETIQKKLGVTVEEVYEISQNGKEFTVDAKVGSDDCRKVVLKEMKNQYGPYYKLVSESKYIREEKKAPAKKAPADKKPAALRTKTERLCGARRKDIIAYAEKMIECLADGSATLKEIEGPAKEDTAIRFVMILNADGSRIKKDIDVSTIRESLAA